MKCTQSSIDYGPTFKMFSPLITPFNIQIRTNLYIHVIGIKKNTGLKSNYDDSRSHIVEIRGMMVGDRE